MKLTFILLLAAVFQVTGNVTAQRVTYSARSAPLKEVFSVIERQTGFVFFYDSGDLAGTRPVSVNFNETPLFTTLKVLMEGQPLEFDVQGKTIFINKKNGKPAWIKDIPQPPGIANGVVKGEDGKPIAGVTIFVKASGFLTMTNEDGSFIIKNVYDGDTLIFTSVNYVSRSVIANTKVPMEVVMKIFVAKLQEVTVVNTGFQTLNRVRATGSFGKPDMDVVSKRTTSMDLLTRLEGQVPGLTLEIGNNNTTGNRNGNGNTTRKTLVRGRTSINSGTDPLYVVNGVPVADISSINLDDIGDITVLKDAAAAAIWGAKAANGVIVITTRTGGRTAQRLNVNYSGFVTYSPIPDLSYGRPMNSRQLIETGKQLFNPTVNPYSSLNNQVSMPHEKILYDQYLGRLSAAEANRKLDSLASLDNMSQIEDLFIRPSIINNHTVSASGGNNVYSFYASLGYTGSQSNTPGERANSYKLNLTQSITAGSRLKLTVNASLINNVSSRMNTQNIGAGFAPYVMFRDAAGNNLNVNFISGWSDSLRQNYQARSRINLDYNPLDEAQYGSSATNNLSINVTANAVVRLWKGLSFVGTYGYLKSPGSNVSYNDIKSFQLRKTALSLTVAPTLASTPVYNYPMTGGSYTRAINDQRNFTVRNQLLYEGDARAGKDHFSLQFGNDVQEGYNFSSTSNVLGYDRQLGTYALIDYARLNNGLSGTVTGFGSLGSQQFRESPAYSRFLSYFGLASYRLSEKYSIDASWRQDYSNLFGKNLTKQAKPTWSFGTKWRIKQEDFMKSVAWLDELGIRATHGIVGNSPTQQQTIEDILRVVQNTSFAPAPAGDALTLSSIANKNLTWEKTHTTNIGIDFAALKNRIAGSIDMYLKKTSDLIGPVYLNPWTGSDLTTGNSGKMVNKGIELSLRTVNITVKDFTWTTALNIGFNKNKVVEFYQSQSALTGAVPPSLGYDSRALWAYRYAGLDNQGDPQVYLADGTITKAPFVTVGKDQIYMGTTQPPVSGGLANNFSYKGFTLALNAVYNIGAVMRREVINTSWFSGRTFFANSNLNGNNLPSWFMDRWMKPGDEAHTDIPSYVASSSNNRRRNLNYYANGNNNVVSASYIKLRDITLNYDLPKTVLRFLRIQRAGIFAQTSNFMIWTANKDGIDPEVPRQFGAVRPGHSYSLGVNLSL